MPLLNFYDKSMCKYLIGKIYRLPSSEKLALVASKSHSMRKRIFEYIFRSARLPFGVRSIFGLLFFGIVIFDVRGKV